MIITHTSKQFNGNMMNEIQLNNQVRAIFHKKNDWKEGLDFLTPNETFIQAGTWWYQKGKKLKAHVHINNERTISFTQETIVILRGKIKINLYNDNNQIFYQEILEDGDTGIILNGGHGYEILEDNTKIVEIKNGPFISVEKDKELLKI